MLRSRFTRLVATLAVSMTIGGIASISSNCFAAERGSAIKILNDRTNVDFKDTPAEAALNKLAAAHNLQIIVRPDMLQGKPNALQEAVSIKASQIRVRTALTAILDQVGLEFVEDDQRVLVATPQMAEFHRRSTNVGREKAKERLESALTQSSEIEFIKAPLKESIDFLADLHNVTIILDDAALSDEGISGDEPVNRTLSDVTLESTLNIILDPLGITWVIEDEVMKITTVGVMQNRLETRVYDIQLSGDDRATLDSLSKMIPEACGPGTWKSNAAAPHDVKPEIARPTLSGAMLPAEAAPVKRKEGVSAESDVDTKAAAAGKRLRNRKHAAPAPKGTIQVFGNKLIVLQNQRVHRQIERLLKKLEESSQPKAAQNPAAR